LAKSYGAAELRLLRRFGRSQMFVLAVVAVGAALFVVLRLPAGQVGGYQAKAAGAAAPSGPTTETRWGPLSPLDRELLTKVRLAGLWEMPAGQMAQERAGSPRVKEVGAMIAEQHAQLDADTRTTAQKLGVMLPSQPNADQQGWLREMSGATGADFDRTFVLRLRAAHGKVFPVIAQARSESKNTEIRAFAERCLRYVNTHMTLLESTGLATQDALVSK
jgi:predicted outer membrane protein